jgi:sugar phosphate permease
MGTLLGPRVNVLIGMGLSVLVCVAFGVSLDPMMLMGLMAVNGLAQATGWSGNVGSMAAWFHKHERGRVMGAWATNFTVGSLASTWVLSWVLGFGAWRATFYAGAAVLAAVGVQFYFLQRNRPEDVSLAPVDDPTEATPTGDESAVAVDASAEPYLLGLSRRAWANTRAKCSPRRGMTPARSAG